MKKIYMLLFVCLLASACYGNTINNKNNIDKATVHIAYTGNSQTKLFWDKLDGAVGYELYRKMDGQEKYEKIKLFEKNSITSYIDNQLLNGKTYYYKLRGYHNRDDKMTYGEYSTVIQTTINNKVPAISQIVSTTNYAKLTWTKSQNCSQYLVYKKIENGSFKKIATLDKNQKSYMDKDIKKNKKYTYKIANETSSQTYLSKEEKIEPTEIQTPQILSVSQYPSQKGMYAKITWEAKKDGLYSIVRKDQDGNYQSLGQMVATSQRCTFYDKTVKNDVDYSYSVKYIKKVNEISQLLSDDRQTMTTISTKPKVSVDFTNLHASISWSKIDDVDGYMILRKVGLKGRYKVIATVGTSTNSYTDVYMDSFTALKEKMLLAARETYLDPSNNGMVYTVRGYKINNHQVNYGNYYLDGDFHLETPSVVGLEKKGSKVTIEWGTVPNAQKYYLYSGYKDFQGKCHWKKVGVVQNKNDICMKKTVSVNKKHTYFTVRAVSQKNEKTVYSSYDAGFNIANKKYNKTHVLFFGDSITFGSPYKEEQTRTVFSYPHRVQQLTNIQYYNPSIPGSTYTYSDKNNRSRMIQIAECIKEGRDVTDKDLTKSVKNGDMYVYETDFVNNQIKGRTFKDFDVIIMAAGTNDYLDDAKLGHLNSKNINEFNGALNTIMGYIQEASDERVKEGKKPIKVVFIDLFYSDRTYNFAQRTNRFIKKNHIGLTLTDYQIDINKLIDRYRDKGMDVYQYENKTINEDNCPYMTSDNLHMSKYGYTQIGNEITKYLIKNNILE